MHPYRLDRTLSHERLSHEGYVPLGPAELIESPHHSLKMSRAGLHQLIGTIIDLAFTVVVYPT